jgi:hypothetical protein
MRIKYLRDSLITAGSLENKYKIRDGKKKEQTISSSQNDEHRPKAGHKHLKDGLNLIFNVYPERANLLKPPTMTLSERLTERLIILCAAIGVIKNRSFL